MDKNQAIRRSNMGFLLLLVALACTLLRLGRTGPYREKHLDLLRIDGTFNSENADAWDFGICLREGATSWPNKLTRGISSIGTIGQVPLWSASEVLTSRSAACPSGSRWSSSRWWWRHFLHQGLVRMAKGSNLDLGFFFHQSHQVMDLKSSNRIKELTAN